MTAVTLYYNARCGTARKVLEAIRAKGIEPEIVLYLETPPSAQELTALIQKMGVPAREVIRAKEALYKELGLDNPDVSDKELIAAMAENPILINRPIVSTQEAALLCRPAERLSEILS